ncbi:SpoIIE family protein phosphatase [Jidongwangia harbinensis]|uniref:SpoIIE family protein phosphatase n=1 Tax=Jidongwangia harbinensis TaxID=2878561 RepID=UPI001CDA41AE|nr:SpoIIE family protein phosphatase [Jidongwangia harbinensis]MCA2216581.1 SpoIIE family protein phosphatase [Jidongwangia harbinensis]
MSGNRPGAAPTDDVQVLLDADPHGCALASAIRAADGSIVDFRLDYLNSAGVRFLGRPADELLGRTYRELWPDTITDGTLPFYIRAVQDRVPAVRTVYYDRASVAGHFEFRIVPFGDGFLARFVDLTKLTVGSQTEGGARLYEALDAAFDGFALLRAVHDDGGAIADFTRVYVNQIGAKLAGSSAEELIGRRVRADSDTLEPGLFEQLRAVAESGEVWQQQIAPPSSGQVWELRAVRVEQDFVAVSYREITEQVRQQQQLARNAEQIRAAAERTAALQAVTAALVAASTPEEVYAAMGAVVRPSAGGHGIAVLLVERGRLVLRYHAGYEQHVVAQLADLPLSHPYPAAQVSRTGEPRYLTSAEDFARAQPDPATAVSGGGRAAWAFLPLSTAGQVLGALVIGYREPREFDDDERANLTAFSRLGAQALQRALLFQSQLSIAADLQRALLPAVLPELAGARHAVRYLPWTRGADVGGDWYDVIHLGPDTAAIVIGDVAGHSPQAAATMGQLRNALRAYAVDGHTPSQVMHRANRLLLRLQPDAMATCCYLELHLAEGTATAVLAGHPPPVLRAGGRAGLLDLRVGPPLGLRDARFADTTVLLPTGSTLVLYTDGLVEDRRCPLDQGLADLCTAVRTAPTDEPRAMVEHILRAGVGPSPRGDDAALLAITVDAELPAGPRTARRRFHGDAVSASAARRFAADVLTAWHQEPLRADACLLLDELVANAVQHTSGDVVVRIALGERLRVDVHDESNRQPDLRPADDTSERYRGLRIVERLSAGWGTAPRPGGGKTVWFELPVPAPPGRPSPR